MATKKPPRKKTQLERAIRRTLEAALIAGVKDEKPVNKEHQFPPRIERELTNLRAAVAQSELTAAQHHHELRTQLRAIARDLAGHAASLARRGRPRLLAVLAKIAQEPSKR